MEYFAMRYSITIRGIVLGKSIHFESRTLEGLVCLLCHMVSRGKQIQPTIVEGIFFNSVLANIKVMKKDRFIDSNSSWA